MSKDMAENMKARLHAGALVVFLVVFALVFLLVVITSTLITFILPESFASSEAALLGRIPLGNDADPLSRMLVEPRVQPQFVGKAMARLHTWCEDSWCEMSPELLKLFHPQTLSDLYMVRSYLLA